MLPLTRSRGRQRFFGASGPSFALNFVNGTMLDPRVTFTRASTGTFFDSAGVLQSAAINAPRFDYNPSTLAAQGLLIEESRTNGIRNNTMVGAVAGTPGTLPTNWSVSGLGTLTQQVVGTGTSNGVTYIDIRFSGTTSTTQVRILSEIQNNIAASNGQSWALSYWTALVGGSLTNITGSGTTINLFDSTPTFLSVLTGPNLNTTASLTRVSAAGTIATVGTAFVQPQLFLNFSSGVAIDVTLRIGLPQLEQGAFATSVIPTTTTALTRAQDRAVVNTLSPWYNSVAGTIYAEFAVTQPSSGANQFVARVSDNSYNNQIGDFVSTTGFAAISTASGGVFDGLASTAIAVSANTVAKFAGAYSANDLAACKDGGTVATDATATIPSGLTRFDLGSDHAGFNNVKAGYLRRITYYPRRLSNAELQAITA
jgi:hypothetical protein